MPWSQPVHARQTILHPLMKREIFDMSTLKNKIGALGIGENEGGTNIWEDSDSILCDDSLSWVNRIFLFVIRRNIISLSINKVICYQYNSLAGTNFCV